MTPTALSLRLLRRRGYLADVCERWVPHLTPPIRKDLFGGFDIVALGVDGDTVGVQTTSLGNLPARVAKLRALASVKRWLACGNKVQLHGWTQRAGEWRCKIVELRQEDMAAIVVEAPKRRSPNRRQQGGLFDDVAANVVPSPAPPMFEVGF